MKNIRLIFIILTIIWMIVVFCLSNEPANKSSQTSSSVIRVALNIVYGNNLSEEEIEAKIEELTPVVRKLAHYSIYTLGGMIIGTAVFTYEIISLKKKILITQIIGSAYSVTDELHQYFIPGRSCEVRDMLIDSSGVLTGIILLLILTWICSIIKKYIKGKERGISV